MIPLALVTGFLGSGKTTYLRHLIAQYRDRRLVYLVNEFSPADVDGHLIESEDKDVYALPGGSIFCTCLVTEFIKALTTIPERFGSETGPVEGVIIEASGVANPKVIEKMLAETRLDQLYALATIVSVVDPATFPVLLQTLPNITAQVESSDVVLLNKTDAFGEPEILDTESKMRDINPAAEIIRTSYCTVDLDLFSAHPARGLHGEYAACADPNYARFAVHTERSLDLRSVKELVKKYSDVLYRLKGFAETAEGVHYLDYTPAAFTATPAPSEPPRRGAELVLIVRGDAYEQGRALAAALKAGAPTP